MSAGFLSCQFLWNLLIVPEVGAPSRGACLLTYLTLSAHLFLYRLANNVTNFSAMQHNHAMLRIIIAASYHNFDFINF